MIDKKLENKVLMWPIFEPEDNFGRYMPAVFSIIPAAAGFGILVDLAIFGISVLQSLFFALLFWGFIASIPHWGKMHVTHGIPDNRRSYSGNMNSKAVAVRFLELDKRDRALFPADFLSTLRDPSLSASGRQKLNRAADAIFEEIDVRDKAKAELARKHIPVDDMVAAMVDSKESVKVESETFKEHVELYRAELR